MALDSRRPGPPRDEQSVALIADNDDITCRLMRRVLEGLGLWVLAARDGEQALRLSREFAGSIHILVTDIIVPKLDGVALFKRILQERPTTKVLLVSGSAAPFKGIPFLPKPFRIDSFKQCVRGVLAFPLHT